MPFLVTLLLLSQTVQPEPPEKKTVPELLRDIERSGRVLHLAPALDDGLRIAPGAPPVLAFRFIEGRERGRFGGLDLVLDDAGH